MNRMKGARLMRVVAYCLLMASVAWIAGMVVYALSLAPETDLFLHPEAQELSDRALTILTAGPFGAAPVVAIAVILHIIADYIYPPAPP